MTLGDVIQIGLFLAGTILVCLGLIGVCVVVAAARRFREEP